MTLKEPREFALQIAGSDLTFYPPIVPPPGITKPPFTIRCLPNFDTFAVEAHNAGTVISEAYFTFLVTTEDEATYGLTEGDICKISDEFYIYSFQLSDEPHPDMTGWSELKTIYLGKDRV